MASLSKWSKQAHHAITDIQTGDILPHSTALENDLCGADMRSLKRGLGLSHQQSGEAPESPGGQLSDLLSATETLK